jgi:hypothetical protein
MSWMRIAVRSHTVGIATAYEKLAVKEFAEPAAGGRPVFARPPARRGGRRSRIAPNRRAATAGRLKLEMPTA